MQSVTSSSLPIHSWNAFHNLRKNLLQILWMKFRQNEDLWHHQRSERVIAKTNWWWFLQIKIPFCKTRAQRRGDCSCKRFDATSRDDRKRSGTKKLRRRTCSSNSLCVATHELHDVKRSSHLQLIRASSVRGTWKTRARYNAFRSLLTIGPSSANIFEWQNTRAEEIAGSLLYPVLKTSASPDARTNARSTATNTQLYSSVQSVNVSRWRPRRANRRSINGRWLDGRLISDTGSNCWIGEWVHVTADRSDGALLLTAQDDKSGYGRRITINQDVRVAHADESKRRQPDVRISIFEYQVSSGHEKNDRLLSKLSYNNLKGWKLLTCVLCRRYRCMSLFDAIMLPSGNI